MSRRSMVEYNISAHQNPNNDVNPVGVSSAVVGYVAMAIGSAVGVCDWLEREWGNEIELMFYLKEKYHFSKENQDALAEILQMTHMNKGPTLQLNSVGENQLMVKTSGGKKIHLAFQKELVWEEFSDDLNEDREEN